MFVCMLLPVSLVLCIHAATVLVVVTVSTPTSSVGWTILINERPSV